MKSFTLKLGILAFTFTVGVFVNAQILRLAYYWIPDVDQRKPASAPSSRKSSCKSDDSHR